ncbi:MAG TPA: type II toxin-antitoxin system VapC family toxin [Xanthobacteraceae bacterium]|jgi:predicted nucleic-acid-binding protein
MRAVDTNVLVRLVVRDDQPQVDAAEEFISSGAWVSHLVLAETSWVLYAAYGLKAEQIAAAVDMLLSHKHLIMQDPDLVGSALDQFKKRSSLGFSDCLVLEIARKAGNLPLGTFDRGLAKLDGAERL